MTEQPPDKKKPSSKKSNKKWAVLIILLITGAFLIAYGVAVIPHLAEARVPVKPISVHFVLNQTNQWVDNKAVLINYHNPLMKEFRTLTDITIPEGLEKEKKDIIRGILRANISSKEIDPQRIDIHADASMLSIQNEKATYRGIVTIQDKNSSRNMTIIDVIIDVEPLPNYGITFDTKALHLTLNATGNSTDHGLISIDNPMHRKLNYSIHAFNSSLTTDLEELMNVTIYPKNYPQRISIDAYNIDANDSLIISYAEGKKSYYGYIEIFLEDGRTVGVIDLRITVLR